MRIVLTIAFFMVLIVVYISLYLMNKRTPLPEGCENLKPDCDGCHDFGCTNHPSHMNRKEENI